MKHQKLYKASVVEIADRSIAVSPYRALTKTEQRELSIMSNMKTDSRKDLFYDVGTIAFVFVVKSVIALLVYYVCVS